MAFLGLVLVVLAAVAATVLIVQNAGSLDVHAFGHTSSMSAYWLVVAGLVTMAVAIIGIHLARWSGIRSRAHVVASDDRVARREAVRDDDLRRDEVRREELAQRHKHHRVFGRHHRDELDIAERDRERELERERLESDR